MSKFSHKADKDAAAADKARAINTLMFSSKTVKLKNVGEVTVLILSILSDDGLYLYKLS